MVHEVSLISWRAPWGATPVALVDGRIAGIALDGSGEALIDASERRLSRGAPLRAAGPLRTAAVARATQEIQASLVIAQRFPRDEIRAKTRIMEACKRKGLAEVLAQLEPDCLGLYWPMKGEFNPRDAARTAQSAW